jgi:hypothetical protein
MTLKAMAVRPGYTNSAVGSSVYTIRSATGGVITQVGNTVTHKFYGSGTFTPNFTSTVEVVVAAGGGGGGGMGGGGGGGGGIIYHNAKPVSPSGYAITIGSGGLGCIPGRSAPVRAPTNGNNSSFHDMISNGGGAGGWHAFSDNYGNVTDCTGKNGGSGGGAGGGSADWGSGGPDYLGGSPTQGPSGGSIWQPCAAGGGRYGTYGWGGGGGGGAGQVGFNGPPQTEGGNTLGQGGAGVFAWSEIWLCGGGGAAGTHADNHAPTWAYGGTGGGGNGASWMTNGNGNPGVINTGGGGSGSGEGWGNGTNSGGSGITIIKFVV